MNTLEQHAQVFKSLSEPVRIRIVTLLLQRESLCVCDMVTVLDLGQSLVSRHLNTLKNAGLVTSQRQGAWMHYQITDSFKENYSFLIQQLEKQMAECEILQQDLAALQAYETEPRTCQTN